MSKFQQRHYEAIAEVLQQAHADYEGIMDGQAEDVVREIESRLTQMFQSDNHLFSAGRFERACIPGANVKTRS